MTHLHLVVRGLGLVAIGAADAAEFLRTVIGYIGMRIADVPGNPLVYDSSVAGDEGVTVAAIIETSHCIMHTWMDQEGSRFISSTSIRAPNSIIAGSATSFARNSAWSLSRCS
jgi:hypothetical protein